MTSERLTTARGRKVVSRASAEQLGFIEHVVLDAEHRAVGALIVGKRRGARIVSWEGISSFGADAVMLSADEHLREPGDERERAAARGKFEPTGRRVLSDVGNELGRVDDIVFDPESGALETIIVTGVEYPGDALLGAGSYALVLRVL